jgi:hypothetical protein
VIPLTGGELVGAFLRVVLHGGIITCEPQRG